MHLYIGLGFPKGGGGGGILFNSYDDKKSYFISWLYIGSIYYNY